MRFSRRHLLRLAGAGSSAVALAACGGGGDDGPDRTVSADATGTSGCVLTPAVGTQFFQDTGLDRRDPTEGRPGSLLELNFTVLASESCLPVGNAVFHIWHVDASGLYSGVAGQAEDTTGETFLRASQVTTGNGGVSFTTIYPGWITGRSTHLNVRVDVDGVDQINTQLFFPDNITNGIYATDPAYRERGPKGTTNDEDREGADLARLRMEVIAANTGHFASHTIGLNL